MTRSKLIAMLETSATSLNALGNKPPTPQPADPADAQVASTILQLILQILEGILAEQPTAGQTAADLEQENATLLKALTDTLTGIHGQNAKASTGGTVDIGGVQINILQLIIQIITAILGQQKVAPLPVAAAEPALESEAVHPNVTSDSVIYAYDTLGRLMKLTYQNGTTTVIFNYDSVGNRTSEVVTI